MATLGPHVATPVHSVRQSLPDSLLAARRPAWYKGHTLEAVTVVLACCLLQPMGADGVVSSCPAKPAGPATMRHGPVEYSAMVLAKDITLHFSNPQASRDAVGRLATGGFQRLWLELIGHGHRADLDTVRRARDLLRDAGFVVSGAITTNWIEGFGQRSNRGLLLCYSAPETHEALAAVTADACRLFDEVMFDDFMFTDCRCDRCTREKGSRSWDEYRCELKNRVAREFILRPGHQANPRAIIIVKYPQWYDKLHLLGYDAVRDTAAFDAIWIGTETRGPDTESYGYVPTYQSTVTYRWLSGIGGRKTRGGWFDFHDCTPDEYLDQAYCTVLNGAREVMLFHAFASLPDGEHAPLMRAFAEHRPHLDALAESVRNRTPLGLVAYKPPNSTPGDEDFWLDYLGNMGIPLVATAQFPEWDDRRGGTLVLTRAARRDPEIDKRVAEWANRGGSLLVSAGFLDGADQQTRALFGLERVENHPLDSDKLFVGSLEVQQAQPMPLGGLLHLAGACVHIWAQVGADFVPLLTVRELPGGQVAAVLNLRTHDTGEEMLMDKPVPWIDLPEPLANLIREVALSGTGLRLEAPPRVIVHPFSGNCVHLINARDTETSVRLRLAEPWFSASIRRIRVCPDNVELQPAPDGVFEFTLPQRARWWLLASGADQTSPSRGD